MKKQKVKILISLAVMVAITVGLIASSQSIYSAIRGNIREYVATNNVVEETPAASAEEVNSEELAALIEEAIASANDSYIAGTYSATKKGYEGDITVTITVSDKAITDVEIVGQHETPALGGKAIKELQPQILIHQSADVDAVANATESSNAIIAAAKEALDMAKGSK